MNLQRRFLSAFAALGLASSLTMLPALQGGEFPSEIVPCNEQSGQVWCKALQWTSRGTSPSEAITTAETVLMLTMLAYSEAVCEDCAEAGACTPWPKLDHPISYHDLQQLPDGTFKVTAVYIGCWWVECSPC